MFSLSYVLVSIDRHVSTCWWQLLYLEGVGDGEEAVRHVHKQHHQVEPFPDGRLHLAGAQSLAAGGDHGGEEVFR